MVKIIKIEKNRSDKNKHQKGFRFPYENGGGFPFNYKWSKGTFRLNDNKKEKIDSVTAYVNTGEKHPTRLKRIEKNVISDL